MGDLEKPPAIDENQIVEQIVRDSPELKRAQQDVLHAEAELKSAKREPIPDLQLRAGVQDNFERLSEASPRTVGTQAFVNAGINFPLFNRNQAMSQLQRQIWRGQKVKSIACSCRCVEAHSHCYRATFPDRSKRIDTRTT